MPKISLSHPRQQRFAEAYLVMADKARYRPGAPSDGFGHALLSKEEAADEDRLLQEAKKYSFHFCKEDDSRQFWIGCTNFRTNRAFMYAIEAARSLCGGRDELAADLLKLATAELQQAKRKTA